MENITGLHINNEINGAKVLKKTLKEDGFLDSEPGKLETIFNVLLIVIAYLSMGLLLLFKLIQSILDYFLV